MKEKIKKLVQYETSAQMVRYLVVAVVIIILEMAVFIGLNEYSKIFYPYAIVTSFVFATILNWYACKRFVFTNSKMSSDKEIFWTFIGSLVGVGIQLGVTAIAVEIFFIVPWMGKLFSMGMTFIWNFFFRKWFVFG